MKKNILIILGCTITLGLKCMQQQSKQSDVVPVSDLTSNQILNLLETTRARAKAANSSFNTENNAYINRLTKIRDKAKNGYDSLIEKYLGKEYAEDIKKMSFDDFREKSQKITSDLHKKLRQDPEWNGKDFSLDNAEYVEKVFEPFIAIQSEKQEASMIKNTLNKKNINKQEQLKKAYDTINKDNIGTQEKIGPDSSAKDVERVADAKINEITRLLDLAKQRNNQDLVSEYEKLLRETSNAKWEIYSAKAFLEERGPDLVNMLLPENSPELDRFKTGPENNPYEHNKTDGDHGYQKSGFDKFNENDFTYEPHQKDLPVDLRLIQGENGVGVTYGSEYFSWEHGI